MFRVFAILPAAGSGDRMNIFPSKQYQLVDDVPVISHTISQFEKLSIIEKVIIVAAVDEFETMRSVLQRFKHTEKAELVPGESSRHGSIYNGLKYMSSGHIDMPPDIVIVHDGVRMFLEDGDLNRVATEAFRYGAAGFIRPPVSTIVTRTKDGFLQDVFDRSLCKASETPQAFKYEIIKEAYENASKEEMSRGTECLQLVKNHCLSARVKLIEGGEHLWKITYLKDLHAARGLHKENSSKIVFYGPENVTWRNLLQAVTKSKGSTVCEKFTSLSDQSIRNVVICLPTFNKATLNSAIKTATDYLLNNCMRNCSMVCVVSYSSKQQSEFRQILITNSQNLQDKGIVVYGVSTEKEPLVNQVGKAIESLFRDRNTELSGQLFIF